MDVRRADLHTHTCYSDGRLRPADLVAKAHAHQLHGIAVTDHDTVDGLAEASAEAKRRGMDLIPGVELSLSVGREEIHLLGYFFDPQHPSMQRHLQQVRVQRQHRAAAMVGKLNDLGLSLSFDEVLQHAPTSSVGRPHIAAALVAGGYIDTYETAFTDYLSNNGPAFVAWSLPTGAEGIRVIHEAGGLAVLAHPGHWMNDRTIMQLIRHGLDGIETIHPSHDTMLTRYYQKLAKEFMLLQTGGSDYHGYRPDEEERFGRFSISYGRLKRLREKATAVQR